MLSDPQSITVNTVSKSLGSVSTGERMSSEYREADGEHTLLIQSSEGKRDRSVVRINHKKTATDPLSAENATVSAAVYMVFDRPKWGYTPAEIDYLVQALSDWATTANVTAVLAGES